jgi:DNA-binding transcriptional regulator LsrR (DeoR family)
MQPAYSPRHPGHRANLLAQVGALYYLDGLTQAEIARQLCLSRPKVSRLLCAAREEGIVRIVVNPPMGLQAALESELEEGFELREVRVVTLASTRSPEWARRQLGAAAAADFARTVRSDHVVGLVGGVLLPSMIDAVKPIVATGVRVVQGVGWENAMPPQQTLMDLVGELARRIDGTPILLPAPSVVASDAVRRELADDAHIGDVLRTLDALDTLYVELAPGVSKVAKAALPHTASTPVGHIALRHFDRAGRLLGTCADGHVVGITLEQMRRARHVVALAHGPANARAFAAALRTRLIDTLITDELTARAIAVLGREVEPFVSTSGASHARFTP